MGKIVIILSILMLISQTIGGKVLASDKENQYVASANEIIVTPVAVKMPVGRVLIVRKNLEYCVLKFTKIWAGKTEEDWYASYESYYQGDKTGDFSKTSVQLRKYELSSPRPHGIGRLAFSFGDKDVKCGPLKLFWFGQSWVYFFSNGQKEGDYGIELAPTKWTDISQVNVFDPRLKWYRYDAKRQDIKIPIDRLWDDKEGGR